MRKKASKGPKNEPMSNDDRTLSYGGNRKTHDGFTGPQRKRLRKAVGRVLSRQRKADEREQLAAELRVARLLEAERQEAAARAAAAQEAAAKAVVHVSSPEVPEIDPRVREAFDEAVAEAEETLTPRQIAARKAAATRARNKATREAAGGEETAA